MGNQNHSNISEMNVIQPEGLTDYVTTINTRHSDTTPQLFPLYPLGPARSSQASFELIIETANRNSTTITALITFNNSYSERI